MKSKGFFQGLINPFTRIAGWQALVIGIVIMVATSLIGYYSEVVFDGVLDIHLAKISWMASFLYPLASQLILILCVWLLAKLFTHGFRFIDVAGTLTLARAPMFLAAIVGFAATTPNLEEIIANPIGILGQTEFIITLFVFLLIEVWTIVLIVNAIKVSCDLQNAKLAGVVIISLFIAELLAKMLLFSFNTQGFIF